MIYTALIGKRDKFRTDIRCFSANKWFSNPRIAAKIYKVLSHHYFSGTTIWLDANIFLKAPVQTYLDMLGEADMALFQHPTQGSVGDELKTVTRMKLDKPQHFTDFLNYYGQEFLNNLKAYECAVLIRRNTEAVRRFNECWWGLICRWSQRDQLTLPIALAECPVTISEITPLNVRKHPLFKFKTHCA